MSSLALNVLLQATMLSTGANAESSYADAYRESMESGRPLVVLVGADWCPACRQAKTAVLPALQRRGTLKDVAFATVNTDHQRSLANKLMQGNSIPQLIVYTRSGDTWQRKDLIGGISISSVESLIRVSRREQEVTRAAAAATAEQSK